MLPILLLFAAVSIAAFLVYAATRPSAFRVVRAARVGAAPHTIFALINEWQFWEDWSPYEKKDPDMRRTYTGPARGAGAVYEFEGNRNVGKGRLEILESVPPHAITIALDLVRPCTGHNIIEFSLRKDGDGGTCVTWAMRGTHGYFGKVMALLFNMDRMIGNDFEAGLRSLKAIAENDRGRPPAYGTTVVAPGT